MRFEDWKVLEIVLKRIIQIITHFILIEFILSIKTRKETFYFIFLTIIQKIAF